MIDVYIKRAWYVKGCPVSSDFSLKMEAGEIVTVRGPSGSGKSTLLSIIAGLHREFDGSVRLGGAVALMPQENSLPPFYTVLQNTMLLSRATGGGQDRERAMELISRLGLHGLENKYPNALSGGELRRAQLAQSLFLEPQILLMDEPFSALDEVTKLVVMDTFLNVREQNKMATVFVTHDASEAEYIGGRVVELSGEGCCND